MRITGSSLPFIAGTGLVTWALSERAFWGRIRPDDSPADSLVTIAAYTAIAYLALVVVRRLAVADARRLFLVGALLGWGVEGLVVGTVYAALPVSVAWTALAWHAPIAVVGGWLLIPRGLAGGGWRATATAAGAGGAIGAWSAFMCVDAGTDPDPAQALLTGGIVAAALALGYGLQGRFRPRPEALRGGRPAIAVGALVVAWAGVAVLPAVPFAPLVIVPLMAVVVRALRRGVPADPGQPFAAVPGVPVRRLAHLAWLPPAAAAGSSLTAVAHAATATGYVVAAGTTLAGGVLLVRILWMGRTRRVPAAAGATEGAAA